MSDAKTVISNYSAAICDVHFDACDIIKKQSRTSLKLGAVPKYHLPKRVRAAFTSTKLSKRRRCCRDDVWQSITALPSAAKGNFVCTALITLSALVS